MSERTSSRYEELYPKTVASQISDVYSKSETSNLFLPKSGGSMGGILDMSGNKITNLAYPTESLDSANKKYVDENNVFKKVKVVDNINLSILESTNINFSFPAEFTSDDLYDVKFVLYEFSNLSLPSQNGFYAGANTSNGLEIINAQRVGTLDKVSIAIPIFYKVYNPPDIELHTVTVSSIAQVVYASSNVRYFRFYCR